MNPEKIQAVVTYFSHVQHINLNFRKIEHLNLLQDLSRLPGSLRNLRSVAVGNDFQRGWPFDLRVILRHNVRRLQLLEVNITCLERLGTVMSFLIDYRGLRALSLIYDSRPLQCGHRLTTKKIYSYDGLLKLSITTRVHEFHRIFLHLPNFPGIESLKCTILAGHDQFEQSAIHQVIVCSKFFQERGNRFKRLSVVSLYSIYDRSCGRVSPGMFTRHLPGLLPSLEHLHIASGSHVHTGYEDLFSLTTEFNSLISFHLVSQPSHQPSKYFERMKTRLSPPSRLPPLPTRNPRILCAPQSILPLYQMFKFASKAKNLRYLSLIFDATVTKDIGKLKAPAMRILHVGTSPIKPLVKETVATQMKMCFPNLRLILHGYHDCVDLEEQEQATTWTWVRDAVCKRHPLKEGDWDLVQDFDFECHFHEVSPIVIRGGHFSSFLSFRH
jgi:hypothetical protein